MDNFFHRPKKREIGELNIVPILDMFVCVIFFLLLSTTFMAYTKNTLPPASTTVVNESGEKLPPLAPRFYLKRIAADYLFELTWQGSSPGEIKRTKSKIDVDSDPDIVIEVTRKMLSEFTKKYPNEKTIQVTMEKNIDYQKLISVIDGAREFMPDVVLFSYEEIISNASL